MLGSLALLAALLKSGVQDPSILLESEKFSGLKSGFLQDHPLIPCLFVTIACGILSGFHATQAPIIARTMKSERQARSSFYGMMIVEGIIAMIWAGAALAVYNIHFASGDQDIWQLSANAFLPIITTDFLGSGLGTVTVIAVIILAITSGDTAMRSLRLSLAEIFHIDQKPVLNRILLCIPLIISIAVLLHWSNKDAASFGKLWNYFAWGNQVLAVFTLGAGCVWLYAKKRAGWISALPCLYMTFIVVSFILWTSSEHKGPAGFGLDYKLSCQIAGVVAVVFVAWCVVRGLRIAKNGGKGMEYVDPNDSNETTQTAGKTESK